MRLRDKMLTAAGLHTTMGNDSISSGSSSTSYSTGFDSDSGAEMTTTTASAVERDAQFKVSGQVEIF